LIEAGIDVVWSNTKHYSLNHSKTIIIDDENIISTGNFSYSSFTKNRDFFIFIKDPEITPILTQIFLNDFYHKKNILYHENLILSPHYSRTKFEILFDSAKNSIKLYFPYIQDEALKNKLIEKSNSGISIELITDKKFQKSSSEAIEELKKS
jgi:polyphosphate kinase